MQNYILYIKKLIVPVFTFLCFFAATHSKADLNANLSDGQTLNLIGIGMHQELRNDIYLGALFGPSPITNPEELLGDDIAKRMSLRFVSSYSNRKMGRHWKERLAMNNPKNKWSPLTREIVGFSKIFSSNLEVGDEVNIDHVPDEGTKVYLNGTLFKTINKPGFMDLLLNVWLGANPPTKTFKNTIRGQYEKAKQKDSLTENYLALTPIPGRFDSEQSSPVQVASLEKEQPKKKTKAKEQNKVITKKTEKPKKAVAAKEVAKNIAPTIPVTAPPVITPGKVAKAEKKIKTVKSTKEKSDSQKAPIKQTNNINNGLKESKPIESKQTEDKAKVASLIKPKEEVEIEEDFFDIDLAAGSYKRELIRSIKKHQVYPRKALEDNAQGSVVLKVIIDKNGKPKHISTIERAKSVHLNRATVRMVKKASPLPPIPAEFKMDEFEFEVFIVYELKS